MSVLLGVTLPRGAVLMADTLGTQLRPPTFDVRLSDRSKIVALSDHVLGGLAGIRSGAEAILVRLRDELDELTTPERARDAQTRHTIEEWETTRRVESLQDVGSFCIVSVLVGFLDGRAFLAANMRGSDRPDFPGVFIVGPGAWLIGANERSEQDTFYRRVRRLYRSVPAETLANAMMTLGRDTLHGICQARPSPVEALIVHKGEPPRRYVEAGEAWRECGAVYGTWAAR